MNITHAENPRSKDVNSYIDLDITLEDGSVYPFTAMPTDLPGAELYKKAKRGDFGQVSVASNDSCEWSGSQWIYPSRESLIAFAEAEKTSRLEEAESEITLLERAARLNIATESEKEALNKWEIYSVLLSRVDTALAPDIEWPEKP